jgi:hypothetical protein
VTFSFSCISFQGILKRRAVWIWIRLSRVVCCGVPGGVLVIKVVTVSKELFEDKESCVAQTEDLGGESDCVEARDGEVIGEGVSGISEGRRR